MSPAKRRSNRPEDIDVVLDRASMTQLINARSFLKRHLIHVREILNGMDFLFLGPHDELHDALKQIVEIEHKRSRFPHVDFARVDEYFLFRIVGSAADLQVITAYFEQ